MTADVPVQRQRSSAAYEFLVGTAKIPATRFSARRFATEPPESKHLTEVKVAESPFYIAMAEEHDLAYEDSVTLDMLTGQPWVIFERRLHPPVYDAVMRLANERKVAPSKLHHIVAPEDAYSFIADDGAVAFVVKSGAMRIAPDGIPLATAARRRVNRRFLVN